MVRFISVKCPECGAALQFEEGRTTVFCSYCGANILMHNDNEYIYRSIDEAEIKQAENDLLYKMKELELEEKEEEHQRKLTQILILLAVGILFLGIIMIKTGSDTLGEIFLFADFMVGTYGLGFWAENRKNKFRHRPGYVKVPEKFSGLSSMHYMEAESALQGSGFTNIKVINLGDLLIGIFKKQGSVASVTISGEVIRPDEWYPHDAPIVISYHGFPK